MNSDIKDDTLYTQSFVYDSLCPYEIISDTINLDCDGLYINIDEIPTKEEYESTIKISPNPARDWIELTLPDVKLPGRNWNFYLQRHRAGGYENQCKAGKSSDFSEYFEFPFRLLPGCL